MEQYRNDVHKVMKSNNSKLTNTDLLIIDEDSPTCTVLEAFFKIKGYTSKSVSTGTKALEVLKECLPKVILLDILLPDIKGFDICKQIKCDEELSSIPVFYTSALPEPNIAEKIQDTKADGYFLKPFDFSEFDILFKYLENKY